MPRVTAGFSLVELVVVLAIGATVSVASLGVLRSTRGAYRLQAGRMEATQSAREIVTVIAAELRELDAADHLGSDIISMSASSIAYYSARNMSFLCEPPDTATGRLVAYAGPGVPSHPLDPSQVFRLFSERDNHWLHVTVSSVSHGGVCGGKPVITLQTAAPGPTALAGVAAGAPLRGYRIMTLERYADANGFTWLGQRSRDDMSAPWSQVQPVAGPLGSSGLQLSYFRTDGTTATVPSQVARIAVAVAAQSLTHPQATARLTAQIALRNNPVP